MPIVGIAELVWYVGAACRGDVFESSSDFEVETVPSVLNRSFFGSRPGDHRRHTVFPRPNPDFMSAVGDRVERVLLLGAFGVIRHGHPHFDSAGIRMFP